MVYSLEYSDAVTAAAAANGKYRGGGTTPFLPVSLRLYRSGHTGLVVSVMCDLRRRIRRAHGIPPRESHVSQLHCFDPYEFVEKTPSFPAPSVNDVVTRHSV